MRLTAVFAALLVSGIVVIGGPIVRERWGADGQYRLAERLYQAGDYEKAEVACQRALKWNPSHAPAKALWMEVQFILGRGSRSPATGYWTHSICNLGVSGVSHQQTLFEIDTAFVRADRAQGDGNLESAERELRKILEFAKWVPEGIEIRTRREQAQAYLERVKALRDDR